MILSYSKYSNLVRALFTCPTLYCVLFFALLSYLIQYEIPYPFDSDTAYHFNVARLISHYGILDSFPWTPFSWQSLHYSDKEFAFHLLFIPYLSFEFVEASRIVGAMCGTAILASIYLLLRAERIPQPFVWAILPMASSVFLFRFALVRPHLLSILLAIVMILALAQKRTYLLAASSILFPLSYVAFWQIPLLLVTATFASHFFSGRKIEKVLLLIIISGICIGLIMHPNTKNVIQLNWIHMYNILIQGAWGERAVVELGNEFYPYSAMEWLRFLAPSALFTCFSVYFSWKQRSDSCVPLILTFATIFFGILTLKSMRFLEYFVPFSVLAIAASTRNLYPRLLAPLLLVITLGYTVLFGTGPLKALFSNSPRPDYVSSEAASLFRLSIPENEQVFTCSWDYTGGLMLALPTRKFIVAADPTLFYLQDPVRYSLWSKIADLEAPQMIDTIRTMFLSRFVLCENSKAYGRLFDVLSQTPGVITVLVDDQWVLFDLGKAQLK